MSTPQVESIKNEIIKRVKAIDQQKQEKKEVAKNYTDTINTLDAEIQVLLRDLEDALRADLVADADEILKEAGDKDLALIG